MSCTGDDRRAKPALAPLGRPVGAGSPDQADDRAVVRSTTLLREPPRSHPVYRRADLRPGGGSAGPAIVTEGTSTTVVQSDQEFEVDGTVCS